MGKVIQLNAQLEFCSDDELIIKSQSGDADSTISLFKRYKDLILSISKSHMNKGVDIAELINAGGLGFIEAIVKFDNKLPFKFSECANHHIQEGILNKIKEVE